MKKILSVLFLAVIFLAGLEQLSFAVEQENTNYLTETFGAAGSYSGPLATSSTHKNYGNWKLRLDVYDVATAQGTEMTVKRDPEDRTNNVLEMKRTQRYDGTNNIVNLESMLELPKNFNTGIVAISFRLKHTNGYTLTIEPFLGELCPDSCMLYSNDYASYDYIRPQGTMQQALMHTSGWHSYKFIIDYNANKTSLYIDEQLIGQPVQFATTISNLNFVQLRGTEYAQTIYYLDDIKVDGLSDVTSYAADSLYFTDKDGMFVQGPQPGGELNRAVISKSSSQAGNGTAVFACFNENNILQSVKTVTIDRVVIHDSAILEDNIIKGVLSFSDGSELEVTDIPASGKTRIVDFPERSVNWVRFTLKEFEGEAAVSEIQVFPVGEKPELVEYIEPWKVINLNQDYTSTWFVSADIDNDGEAEMLGCRCALDGYEGHPVVNACAFELDGTIIWTWGEGGAGADDPGGDPGFQIYDIDNDGVFEVLLTAENDFVILDARNGKEKKRYPLPKYESDPTRTATDAITIANISGNDYPSDIIIKTRYWSVWAFTKDWDLIWYFDMPGGMQVGHRPYPVDIDNDGYDEVSIGFCMINPDGSIRYMLDPDEFKSPLIYEHSHCDSFKMAEYYVVGDVDGNSVINEKDAVLLRKLIDGEQEAAPEQFRAGDTDGDGILTEKDYELLEQKLRHEIKAFPNRGLSMEDVRICLCLCGGFDIVMIDGNGKRVWAQEDGMHYETIVMAQMFENSNEKQIVTNPFIPSQVGKCTGTMPIYIFDMEGNLLEARYSFMEIRFPCVINWNGKQDYLYMGPEGLMYDGNMRIRARTLAPTRGLEPIMLYPQSRGDKAYNLDLNGDGRQDIVNRTITGNGPVMYIYLNERGKVVADDIGSGYNVTFY